MTDEQPSLTADALGARLRKTAFAFRGYNVTNLGRTPELWDVPAYRPVLAHWLEIGSQVCRSVCGGSTDLVARVVGKLEADLDHYAEAVALIMSVELAQIQLLRESHGVDYSASTLAFGYSLGELTAVAANEITPPEEAMRVPISLAEDCAALARGVRMGIVFSRRAAIEERAMHSLCEEITAERRGVIAVSAVLSPEHFLSARARRHFGKIQERPWRGDCLRRRFSSVIPTAGRPSTPPLCGNATCLTARA